MRRADERRVKSEEEEDWGEEGKVWREMREE